MPSASEKPPIDQRTQFLGLLSKSLEAETFVKLILAKYRGSEPELLRVIARRLTVRGEPCLSFVYRYKTRDVTKNVPVVEAIKGVGEELGASFENAHLLTSTQDIQLAISRKGKYSLRVGRTENAEASAQAHDREKHRFIDLDRPFLTALGVSDANHRLIPAMSRKWKQINKFVEVFDHALSETGLKGATQVRVIDFGCGKGYLTFAIHDYLTATLALDAQVMGVELREDLVQFCATTTARLGVEGLSFELGDIRSHANGRMDVMIALHACDTATDYAIHAGIRSGASIIMCAPCCHKEIRPQMRTPLLLRPMLQHGIHLGQEAEMLTDGLRALLLNTQGYDTKVFEFVSLEHTSKNKMILAIKHARPTATDALRTQIREIKDFYGIQSQCLETLLAMDASRQ